ncbi:syntenin-1-like [Anneissia japonica]|uniref:syntenin-1-like n=1 Tax=Anneissia japonica TaxID=1529436 RepID=UPI0014258E70|nr:syntenin-1-like [Anneissia japonica]
MSLYPSLEDMKVDQMAQAQVDYRQHVANTVTAGFQPPNSSHVPSSEGSVGLYPSLDEYMGLCLTPESIAANMPVLAQSPQTVAVPSSAGTMVAPVTGQTNLGLARAEVKQGIREIVVCKDSKGKIGMRVQAVSKGIFVAFVLSGSPAAMGGLRFGDQILQINGTNVAGWSRDKTMDVLKKADAKRITFAVRDRPFERTITLQKDSAGYVGFVFKNGKITAIAKDTSAARNGLLIDHALLEVNGQNVIGLKDKEISEILHASPKTVTITIMPNFVFDHMMKSMSSSLVKKSMDHSIPDV